QKYLIIHQTGKLNELNLNSNSGKEEKINQSNSNKYFKFNPFGLKGYLQIEFIYNGIAELMKLSDLIISRAGANLVFEIVASKTPAIFIPLKTASRGEQENNARYFSEKGNYIVLDEEKLDDKILFNEIEKIFDSQIYNPDSPLDSQVATINISSLIKAEDIIISSIEKELKINS
ncbi:MAG TPA: glycosyltransferase, partial [Exilispira sp.]|nr:glycosyltransferase [Exilispira sp.]